MKRTQLQATKVYWVAQNRGSTAEREVFRRYADAAHFVDHRVEGWAGKTDGYGWVVFKCYAGEMVTL